MNSTGLLVVVVNELMNLEHAVDALILVVFVALKE